MPEEEPEVGCGGEMHAGSERSAARGREGRASRGRERRKCRAEGGTGAVGVECVPAGGSDGDGGRVGDSASDKTEGGAGASEPGSRLPRRHRGPCDAGWWGAACEKSMSGGRGGTVVGAICPVWYRKAIRGERRSWGWTAGGRGSRGWKCLGAVCEGC